MTEVTAVTALRIDIDQHLFEARDTWSSYMSKAQQADALTIEDDRQGWPWLVWRGQRLAPVEVQHPRRPEEIGDLRLRMERGEPAPGRYEELLPAEYGGGPARLAALDAAGLDAAALFPNFGLVWEGALGQDPPARRANLRAYNRWMVDQLAVGAGRLYGVAHVTLDDIDWLAEELDWLGAAGVRLAMMAPAPVTGKGLAHRDLDPAWRAFCRNGIAPVFHVGSFESPIDAAWHGDDSEPGDKLLDSVFLWIAPAVALANLIVNGTLERFPELRIGVVELTAGWVPGFLLNVDGALDFYRARHPGAYESLALRPSEYFLRQVRVAALPYEAPDYLVRKVGADTFMVGSDWPHAEGVADPAIDAARAVTSLDPDARDKVLGTNAAWLLALN